MLKKFMLIALSQTVLGSGVALATVISTTGSNPTLVQSVPVTVKFGDPIVDFSISNSSAFNLSNATLEGPVTQFPQTNPYQFSFNLVAANAGTFSMSINAGAFTRKDGKKTGKSNILSLVYTPSTVFTPLHTYYLSPNGSDANDGLSPSTAWLTPNHNVVCGDVILAAAGSYTNQFNQQWGTVASCPSSQGGIDGKGGINFAVLLCAGPDLESCKVSPSANQSAFDVQKQNYWAVEGFKATTNGPNTSNSINPAYIADIGNLGYCGNGTNVYHHIAFINDIAYNSADGFGNGGCSSNTKSGQASIDYMAIIGDIAQNSAQGNPNSWLCVAAIDIVGPANSDNLPGTHMFVNGNFSYNNVSQCPSDVENYMFDTWDAHAYSGQGVALNNVGFLASRMGFQIFDQSINPTTANIYLLNNTLLFAGQTVENQNNGWATGDINLQKDGGGSTFWGGLTIQQNLVLENEAFYGGTGQYPVYGLTTSGGETNVTIGGNGTQNFISGIASVCDGPACNSSSAPYSAISFGTAADLGTNFYTNPAFNNTADLIANRSGVPDCTGFSSTTACMGYNAVNKSMRVPSVISDIQAGAAGASTSGYQLPSTACETSGPVSTYYPSWLKGIVYLHWDATTGVITENADLVTKPCGL